MRTSLPPYVPPAAKSQRWRLWVLGGVVLALVVTSIVVRILQPDPPSLPRIAEQRPSFQTIRVSTSFSKLGGQGDTYTTESDANGKVLHIKGSENSSSFDPNPTSTLFEFILAADETWSFDYEHDIWVKAAEGDTAFYEENQAAVTTLMLSDYVPDTLRPYVTVKSIKDDTVFGHVVKVYDMRLDVPAYRDSKAADYQQWRARMGIDAPKRNTTLTLSVDANGVVWRMQSYSSLGASGANASTYERRVEELSATKFQPPYPDTYFDNGTGRQVG